MVPRHYTLTVPSYKREKPRAIRTLISVQSGSIHGKSQSEKPSAPLDHPFEAQSIVRQLRVPVTRRRRFGYTLVGVEVGRKPSYAGCPRLLRVLYVRVRVVLPDSGIPAWMRHSPTGHRGWAWITGWKGKVAAGRPAACPSLRRGRMLLGLHELWVRVPSLDGLRCHRRASDMACAVGNDVQMSIDQR